MRKLFFMAVAAIAVSVASCGNKTNANANANDTDSVAVMNEETQNVADSLTSALTKGIDSKDANAIQSTIAALQTKYAELVKGGKLDEAKAYASQVKNFISEHADQIKSATAGNATIATLIEGVKKLPTSAATTAEDAAAAVKTNAQDVVSNTKEAAKEATDKAKEDIKTKTNEAVDNVKQKANDAANKAVDKAVKGLGL